MFISIIRLDYNPLYEIPFLGPREPFCRENETRRRSLIYAVATNGRPKDQMT